MGLWFNNYRKSGNYAECYTVSRMTAEHSTLTFMGYGASTVLGEWCMKPYFRDFMILDIAKPMRESTFSSKLIPLQDNNTDTGDSDRCPNYLQ